MADLKVTFPTLYKMDSKGKIRQWSITAWNEGPNRCHYEQEHGLLDGKLQTTSTKVSKGKNIGKANETSAWEQCKLEAESLWKKQKERKGYSETIPTDKPKLPMLAKSYKNDGKKIVWPAYCQPKLDGIRCIMTIKSEGIEFRSRQNKIFTTLDHISASLENLDTWIGFSFDGELYNHELHDDFQTLVSAIKRDKPSDKTNLIQYHIYDICCDYDFNNRLRLLDEFKEFENDYLKIVDTFVVNNESEFLKRYVKFVNEGYEGAILRNRKGPYEYNKRSPNLQKHKEFIDEEFEVVGAYQNKGKMANQCTFECITKDGAVFGVKPKGTDQQREQMWKDFQDGKLTGKMMTVRFFEWTNSDPPVPRFPIGIAIREYE